MQLTAGEALSPLWLRIEAHFTERLKQHRLKNDGKMDEADRNKLIGQIQEIKGFLALKQEQEPSV